MYFAYSLTTRLSGFRANSFWISKMICLKARVFQLDSFDIVFDTEIRVYLLFIFERKDAALLGSPEIKFLYFI